MARGAAVKENVNQAATIHKPSDVGLDDPAFGKKLKSCCRVTTLNDFQLRAAGHSNELEMHLRHAGGRKF